MSSQRVYVPYALDGLSRLVETGEVGPAPFTAYAVTPDVVSQTPESDDEEREHLVALVAARASLERVVSDPAAPWRRVVLVVDVDRATLRASISDDDPSAVEVATAPHRADVAAIFVDDDDAQTAVALAAQTHDLSVVDDVDLLWFAPSELVDLLP